MEFYDVFKKNYLVSGLPEDAVREIAGLASYQVYLADEEIIRRGSNDTDLIFVLDGLAAVLSESGEKLAEVGPGSVLGEIALLDNQPRSASVVASVRVQAAHIPAQDLRKLLGTQRDIGFIVLSNLCQVLCFRLRQTGAKLDDMAEKVASADPWKHAH